MVRSNTFTGAWIKYSHVTFRNYTSTILLCQALFLVFHRGWPFFPQIKCCFSLPKNQVYFTVKFARNSSIILHNSSIKESAPLIIPMFFFSCKSFCSNIMIMILRFHFVSHRLIVSVEIIFFHNSFPFLVCIAILITHNCSFPSETYIHSVINQEIIVI